MDYFLLIVAILFAGVAVLRIFYKKRTGTLNPTAYTTSISRSGPAPQPEPETPRQRTSFDPRIENAGPGGVIRLTAVGPDMKDLDAQVVSRHLYREDGYEWYELECETAEGTLWIDVEEDDGVKVDVTLRTLDLEDTGLSPEDLENLAREKRGNCKFEGKSYRLRETGKATFYRDGNRDKGEKFRYWDFATSDRYSQLSIELWGEAEYQVHLGQPIRPHQITVYSERGETR